MKNTDGLLECSRKCMELGVSCETSDCRHWINYPQEFNCCLVSVYENGPMTLRQVAERIHLSFARIKQIETKALQKIKNASEASILIFNAVIAIYNYLFLSFFK